MFSTDFCRGENVRRGTDIKCNSPFLDIMLITHYLLGIK